MDPISSKVGKLTLHNLKTVVEHAPWEKTDDQLHKEVLADFSGGVVERHTWKGVALAVADWWIHALNKAFRVVHIPIRLQEGNDRLLKIIQQSGHELRQLDAVARNTSSKEPRGEVDKGAILQAKEAVVYNLLHSLQMSLESCKRFNRQWSMTRDQCQKEAVRIWDLDRNTFMKERNQEWAVRKEALLAQVGHEAKALFDTETEKLWAECTRRGDAERADRFQSPKEDYSRISNLAISVAVNRWRQTSAEGIKAELQSQGFSGEALAKELDAKRTGFLKGSLASAEYKELTGGRGEEAAWEALSEQVITELLKHFGPDEIKTLAKHIAPPALHAVIDELVSPEFTDVTQGNLAKLLAPVFLQVLGSPHKLSQLILSFFKPGSPLFDDAPKLSSKLEDLRVQHSVELETHALPPFHQIIGKLLSDFLPSWAGSVGTSVERNGVSLDKAIRKEIASPPNQKMTAFLKEQIKAVVFSDAPMGVNLSFNEKEAFKANLQQGILALINKKKEGMNPVLRMALGAVPTTRWTGSLASGIADVVGNREVIFSVLLQLARGVAKDKEFGEAAKGIFADVAIQEESKPISQETPEEVLALLDQLKDRAQQATAGHSQDKKIAGWFNHFAQDLFPAALVEEEKNPVSMSGLRMVSRETFLQERELLWNREHSVRGVPRKVFDEETIALWKRTTVEGVKGEKDLASLAETGQVKGQVVCTALDAANKFLGKYLDFTNKMRKQERAGSQEDKDRLKALKTKREEVATAIKRNEKALVKAAEDAWDKQHGFADKASARIPGTKEYRSLEAVKQAARMEAKAFAQNQEEELKDFESAQRAQLKGAQEGFFEDREALLHKAFPNESVEDLCDGAIGALLQKLSPEEVRELIKTVVPQEMQSLIDQLLPDQIIHQARQVVTPLLRSVLLKVLASPHQLSALMLKLLEPDTLAIQGPINNPKREKDLITAQHEAEEKRGIERLLESQSQSHTLPPFHRFVNQIASKAGALVETDRSFFQVFKGSALSMISGFATELAPQLIDKKIFKELMEPSEGTGKGDIIAEELKKYLLAPRSGNLSAEEQEQFRTQLELRLDEMKVGREREIIAALLTDLIGHQELMADLFATLVQGLAHNDQLVSIIRDKVKKRVASKPGAEAA